MLTFAKKYILAFPKIKENFVLRILEDVGDIEVIDKKEIAPELEQADTGKALQETEYSIASLDFAIAYLEPFIKKLSLRQKLKGRGIVVDKAVLKEKAREEAVLKAAKRVENIEKDIELLRREREEAEEKAKEMEKFGDLGFAPQDTVYTFSFVAALPAAILKKWQEALMQESFYQRELSRSSSKVFILLFGLKEDREKAMALVKSLRGERQEMNYDDSPRKISETALSALKEIDNRLAGFNRELYLTAAELMNSFKFCRDFLTIKRTQLRIRQMSAYGSFLNYISFWAPEPAKKIVEKRLAGLSPEITILGVQNEENEQPPALLKNNKIVRPFQYVTEMFGVPRLGEIDPTPYLALFFIIFFGICLTDAGYGAIIILFTLLPLLFMKNLFKDTKLVVLLFYGGISTLLMGVLFGSYFGASVGFLERYPLLLKLKQIDPIEDTVLFMILSFALGYLQIFFAQIIRVVSGIKNRNRAMLSQGVTWGLFYIAVVFLGTSILKVPSLKTISIAILIGSGAALLWSEGAGQKIFFRPLIGAIKVLQGLIGAVSDILSYSRLVALGLATAVIALIVNQIAFLLGDMIPYVGWLFTALVLIGGHVFNVAINALGAFIHSARLQFVEFFPKFLEGGGRRFKPTRSELKYITLLK